MTIVTTLSSFIILISTQFIDSTEALFITEIAVTGESTSAFVFPATLEEILNRMNTNENELIQILDSGYSLQNIEQGSLILEQINATENIFALIQSDYQLLEIYYTEVMNKFPEDKAYQFVIEDYEEGSNILHKSNQLMLRKTTLIDAIQSQILELEQKLKEETKMEDSVVEIPIQENTPEQAETELEQEQSVVETEVMEPIEVNTTEELVVK